MCFPPWVSPLSATGRRPVPGCFRGFPPGLWRKGGPALGRHSVRQSLVVLQAMYEQAIRWGWVPTNPVKAVKKPPAKRERAVLCLAPSEVEAIRAVLVARGKQYAATMVSLVAYQGLRVPEELLALECRHVRRNTLLVEQRNIDGRIIGGQKVRGFHPRAIDLLDPVRRDVRKHMLALRNPRRAPLPTSGRRPVASSRLPELAPAHVASGA